MNDRPDLAVLSGADGVHVGQDELTVKDARRILGPSGLIGVSTHSLEQARAAVLDGANYIGVGPTFPSGTKQFAEFTGIELLRAVQAEIRLPAFAIGGITEENLPQVLATGFRRVAVSGAIADADDPAAAASAHCSQMLAGLIGFADQPTDVSQQLFDQRRHFVAQRRDRSRPKPANGSSAIEHERRRIGQTPRSNSSAMVMARRLAAF